MLKRVARVAIHEFGGLAILRKRNRRRFSIPVFHAFSAAEEPNLEALCSHISRNFEVVSLSFIVDALRAGRALPDKCLSVTVDDGYRNFVEHGHPIFRKYKIPVTLYAVTGFADRRLWLWTDQIAMGLAETSLRSIRINIEGEPPMDLPLATTAEKAASTASLLEALKRANNAHRLKFLTNFENLCKVQFPSEPPTSCAAMSWEELRAIGAEGVEIGCHTETHPILSRVSDSAELDREIRGAKDEMERRLKVPVRHFCYPNGLAPDINEAVRQNVRNAGYDSAVTCSWGLNTSDVDPIQIRRTPMDSTIDLRYGFELLAGLHMR